MDDRLRIGLFQSLPEKWALDKNFDKFLNALDTASEKGVELLVAPESFLDGYAAPDEQSTRERLFGIAQEVGKSRCLEKVSLEAKSRRMSIVFGFTQKVGDKLYNAAGLWDSDGELVGIYHKTHLQAHDLQYDFGQSLPVFDSQWGKVGIMICADRRWPEVARCLRLQGARLLVCPTYGLYHEGNECWMRTRSFENDCFLAFAHPMVSFVTDPAGDVVAKLENEDGGVLAVDIDLSQTDRHLHLDDRRPDLYGKICDKPDCPI